jgi:N-acetylglutamate synthase-like GNAT family acetyltransferase
MTYPSPPAPTAPAAPSIRRATAQDADAVAACVDAAYKHWVPVLGMRPGPMNQDYVEVLATAQAFIAENREGIRGVLILRADEQGFLLENVAVHPRARGTGLGRSLLELAEREAVAQGYDSIYLYTHELMATNIACYLARGYVEFARRCEHGLARVYMRKALLAQ